MNMIYSSFPDRGYGFGLSGQPERREAGKVCRQRGTLSGAAGESVRPNAELRPDVRPEDGQERIHENQLSGGREHHDFQCQL